MSDNIVRKADAIISSAPVFKVTKEAHTASLEAKEILARAQDQAEQLIEQTNRENETRLAESTRRGYEAGLAQWNDALVDAWKQRDDYLSKHESEVIKLALAVAKKIIGATAAAGGDSVLHAIKGALHSVRSGRKVVIKVNPSDEVMVRDHAASLKMLSSEIVELVVVSNHSIEAGGCVVETDLGVIDAQIATQLASIEGALLRRFDVSNH